MTGLLAFAYVSGGLAYNVRVKEMPLSTESLPHLAQWKELGALVYDGVMFSRGAASVLYARMRGRGGMPPSDPSLTQRLANVAADEGAENGREM